MGGPPSKIVLLNNMCGVEDVDDDLAGEVKEEADRFGVVNRVVVWNSGGEVRIFLIMSGLAGAYNVVKQFEGRFFGGRVVRAR